MKAHVMFVLTHVIDYEGDILLGIYTTRKLALQAEHDYCQNRVMGKQKRTRIREIEVNTPAEFHW